MAPATPLKALRVCRYFLLLYIRERASGRLSDMPVAMVEVVCLSCCVVVFPLVSFVEVLDYEVNSLSRRGGCECGMNVVLLQLFL